MFVRHLPLVVVPFVFTVVVPAGVVPVHAQAPEAHAHRAPPLSEEPHADGRDGGSGTSWLPQASVAQGPMWHAGNWMLMAHGRMFLQYVDVGGPRGDTQLGSVNWLMAMAQRGAGEGRLTLRAMGSLEPLTVGRCGYPDLVQSGESCRGVPLHDRQHPHDMFMELAAVYTRPVGRGLSVQLYGGPAGEPALGPVAYPHRPSAALQPLAPIAHHWLDATHVTFGVVTAGISGGTWKAEVSRFNGREPDDARYGFDTGPLDSTAARATWLPLREVAVQASYGLLRDAHHGADVRRVTASMAWQGDRTSATLAWGVNAGDHDTSHGVLFESSVDLTETGVLSIRAEAVQKSGGDLGLADHHSSIQPVVKLQGAYVHHLRPRFGLRPGVGAGVGYARLPASFATPYGGRWPSEFSVFVTLAPSAGGR